MVLNFCTILSHFVKVIITGFQNEVAVADTDKILKDRNKKLTTVRAANTLSGNEELFSMTHRPALSVTMYISTPAKLSLLYSS